MFYRNLGVFASLALAANAVLIPPGMTADTLGDDNAMETLAVNPFKRTVALECPRCAFAADDGKGLYWKSDAGNAFLLDFEVGAREDTLNIDGVQLYPPTFGYLTEPFFVTQIEPHKESEDALRLRVTGYTFHYNSAETVTEAGTELLPMTFRITSIEGMAVDPPALTINLLKDVNGRLMIASFQSAPADEVSPTDQDKECKEWPLLCKWRSILADKINGIKSSVGKGCHKHKSNPMEQETTHGKPPHTFRPGHPHHRPHHQGHHRHHSHHRLHMFLRRAFFTIFIPILIGIFAGTLTYIIGMALGCLIAIAVTKIRGRAPYETVAQDEGIDESDDDEPRGEKEVYAELPEYDAPPTYEEPVEEEPVEKEVVDEAH